MKLLYELWFNILYMICVWIDKSVKINKLNKMVNVENCYIYIIMQVNNKNLERECQILLIFKFELENIKFFLKRSLIELVIKIGIEYVIIKLIKI